MARLESESTSLTRPLTVRCLSLTDNFDISGNDAPAPAFARSLKKLRRAFFQPESRRQKAHFLRL
jgi:hypothetical protein